MCKLHKSIYGLKQASRQWFDKFSKALLSLGFRQTKTDYSLFTRGSGKSFIALLVYVDDVILTGASLDDIDTLKQHVNSSYKLKDLGPLRYFLGLELSRSSKGMFLSQRHYVLNMIEDAGLLASKPTALPLDPHIKLFASDGAVFPDPLVFRRLIGKLLYLTISRPDITFVVHKLSQFMAHPRQPHLSVALSLVRYLKGTSRQGVFLQASSSFQLKVFTDSDWASCVDTRKSTSGFCIFLGESLVSWKSKKQSTVSRSSAKVEYRALAVTTTELLWLQQLLEELHIKSPSP